MRWQAGDLAREPGGQGCLKGLVRRGPDVHSKLHLNSPGCRSCRIQLTFNVLHGNPECTDLTPEDLWEEDPLSQLQIARDGVLKANQAKL